MAREYILAEAVEHLCLIGVNMPVHTRFLRELEQYKMIEPVSSDELDAMLKEKSSLQREFSRLESSVLDAEEIMQAAGRLAGIAVDSEDKIIEILRDYDFIHETNSLDHLDVYSLNISELRGQAKIIKNNRASTTIDKTKNISWVLRGLPETIQQLSKRHFDSFYRFPVNDFLWEKMSAAHDQYTSSLARLQGTLAFINERYGPDMPRYREMHGEMEQMDARIAEVHSVGSSLYRITNRGRDLKRFVNAFPEKTSLWTLEHYDLAEMFYSSTAEFFSQKQIPSNPSNSQHQQDCMQQAS